MTEILFARQTDLLGLASLSIAQTWTANQNNNQSVNSNVAWQSTNANAGTAALASFVASNGTGAAIFGVGGTSYSSNPLFQNRAFLNSGLESSGIVINNMASNPIIFGTLGTTELARIGPTGGLALGTTTDPGKGRMILAPGVYSGLPAPSSSLIGSLAVITDANVTTSGSVVSSGGGTDVVLIACGATDWKVVMQLQ